MRFEECNLMEEEEEEGEDTGVTGGVRGGGIIGGTTGMPIDVERLELPEDR